MSRFPIFPAVVACSCLLLASCSLFGGSSEEGAAGPKTGTGPSVTASWARQIPRGPSICRKWIPESEMNEKTRKLCERFKEEKK